MNIPPDKRDGSIIKSLAKRKSKLSIDLFYFLIKAVERSPPQYTAVES
jgi:hypothetical protein